jgi:acyl-CoA thioesterase FadM
MDPLAHVNHPAYVDFADEATSRAMLEVGLDPVQLAPIAEETTFKSGVVAGDRVLVETRVIGRLEDAAVLEHRISAGERLCARVVAIRALASLDALLALR